MRLSLVVTVKNEARDADRLIQDILAQTRSPDEWLLVDGGSTDGTAEIFERADGCTVLRHPGNIAQGRNHGIEHSRGEVIATTDGGCRLEDTWLESLVRPLDQGTDGGAPEFVGGPSRALLERPFDLVQWALLDQLNFRVDRRRPPFYSCRSLAFRRRLWQKCRFPEWLDHGEDAWIFDQWRRLGSCAPADTPAVIWRMRPDLRSFWWQHFRYMKGDGSARMRLGLHGLRAGFYLFLSALFVLGLASRSPGPLYVVAGTWTSYLLLNAARLFQVARRERKLEWWWRSLALLPAMLIVLDGAKLAGVVAGLVTSTSTRRAAGSRELRDDASSAELNGSDS